MSVTVSYISMLEIGKNPKTGRPSRPSYGLLCRLAEALQLDPEELKRLAGYTETTTSYVRRSPYGNDHLDVLKNEMRYTELLANSQAMRTIIDLFENTDIPPKKRAKIDTEVASFAKWKIDSVLKTGG